MQDWIAIHITNDEVEVNLKKGVLEGEGINCVIETSIYRPRAVVPLFNEFKLYVPKSQASQAKGILEEMDN